MALPCEACGVSRLFGKLAFAEPERNTHHGGVFRFKTASAAPTCKSAFLIPPAKCSASAHASAASCGCSGGCGARANRWATTRYATTRFGRRAYAASA